MMTLAAVLCCALTTTLFTSCGDDEVYPTRYRYEVTMTDYVSYNQKEYVNLQNAFNSAIGTNGTSYTYHKDKQDSKMKSACDIVYKQYASTVTQSLYMKFSLIRYSGTAEPGKNDVGETIATYEFGLGLTQPYVKYVLADNRDNAYAALEAKKATLDEETYRASLITLEKLVGRHKRSNTSSGDAVSHTITSVFEAQYQEEFKKPWLDNETSTQALITTCDKIADEHVNDVLAVEVVVTVTKTGFFDKKVATVWERTFHANVE